MSKENGNLARDLNYIVPLRKENSPLDRIIARIKLLEMSQAEIAERGFGGKTNQPYVSGLLTGKRTMTRIAIENFAKALGVLPVELDPNYIPLPPRREPFTPSKHGALGEGLNAELVKLIDRTFTEFESQAGSRINDEKRLTISVKLYIDHVETEYSYESIKAAFFRLLAA